MVHDMQRQFRHMSPFLDSDRTCIFHRCFDCDQEVNVVGIPVFFKGFANGEDRLAEASDLINVWMVLDPTLTDVPLRQGGRRLKKRVRYQEGEKLANNSPSKTLCLPYPPGS